MTPNRGWGLFTTKAIKKEDAIAVDGEVITAAEERKRMREYLRKNEAYLFRKYEIHDHDRLNSYFVDNKQIGNLARFLNHSCKPNFSTWTVSNGRQVSGSDYSELMQVGLKSVELTSIRFLVLSFLLRPFCTPMTTSQPAPS